MVNKTIRLKAPYLNSSFGCVSLKTGSLIIGYLSLVQCLISMPFFWDFPPAFTNSFDEVDPSIEQASSALGYVKSLFCWLLFVACVMMLFDVHNDNPQWIAYWLIVYSAATFADHWFIFTFAFLSKSWYGLLSLARILLRFYFLLVVYSQYHFLRLSDSGRRSDQVIKEANLKSTHDPKMKLATIV